MEPIELSRWEPSPEDPRRKQYAGQRTAQEVFEELRHRLEGMGYLPDEYFLMNRDWENGREIPRGADIFCTTDYGGSEGIYLDVSLQWYENDRTVTRNFITGKTLGETGADLDRMFLISSAITKAFHGDRGTYARYLSCGEQPEPEAMIVHLDPAEQRTIIQALVEQRERQEQAMSQTEQLLRRMTGSITAYMEEVGQRPLRMSDYDKTVLAIQDGELTEFWARYDAVLWAVEQGITGGTGGGKFSPDTPCTRAQMATFLWRANGSTEVTGTTPFSDVSAETYYYNAVLWAYEQNITNGTGGGKFSPDATCTRAQMVQMLKNASDAV